MEVSNVLAKYGLEPKGFRDQHFIDDEKNVRELVKILAVKKNDTVFEVGCGIGTFTSELPACKKIYACDIDPDVLAVLRAEVRRPDLAIVQGDALKELPKYAFTKLISSTPYTICEPLLHRLFVTNFTTALLVVPEKFAESITVTSSPLGFFAETFLNINPVKKISRDHFLPRPRVDSAALLITKKSRQPLQELYLQKDKKVKNILREWLCKHEHLTKQQARERIASLGTTLEKHPLRLTYEELKRIAPCFAGQSF